MVKVLGKEISRPCERVLKGAVEGKFYARRLRK